MELLHLFIDTLLKAILQGMIFTDFNMNMIINIYSQLSL